MASKDELLKEIRDRYEYAMEAWSDIRKEAATDMKFVSGDPWDPKERARRKEAARPCLSLDELSQYINQRINDVRQNKRAIKVSPGDGGGDEKTAELHADIIRTIEYKSNAQAAYCTAFENALQRSYGYFRIGSRYINPRSFDQELYIGRIPNPEAVLIDPDCKEADCSDMEYAFVMEEYRQDVFKSRWPDAEIKDFPGEMLSQYPHWIRAQSVQVSEYWKIKKRTRKLLLVGKEENPTVIFQDELPKGAQVKGEIITGYLGGEVPILQQRKSEVPEVVQYITNGVEILEENEWDGKYIPIVPVFGKEIYVPDGTGSKRVLLSLIRFSRDPQMLYCYYRTAEAEAVGQTPKTPFVGYEGQFEGHEEEWSNVNTAPLAYLQVKPIIDATGQAVLPLPQRQVYEPPIQSLEMGAESAKRAIQSSMGMYNSSVGRQDSAAKSGIAIRALDLQSDQGNFHFIDNYDRALEHAGRILDDLIPKKYDTARQVSIRKPDDTQTAVTINAPAKNPKTGQMEEHRVGPGDHSVTISTGPSYQSQREEASAFADSIAQQPEIFSLIGDLVVKLKNLGPIGDEISKRLTPPQFKEDKQNPQAMAQQMQQASQMIEALTAQVNKLTDERNAKTIEIESKERLESMKLIEDKNTKALELDSRERIEALKAEVELAKINAQLSSKENLEMMKAELERVRLSIEALRAENPPKPAEGATQ